MRERGLRKKSRLSCNSAMKMRERGRDERVIERMRIEEEAKSDF